MAGEVEVPIIQPLVVRKKRVYQPPSHDEIIYRCVELSLEIHARSSPGKCAFTVTASRSSNGRIRRCADKATPRLPRTPESEKTEAPRKTRFRWGRFPN
jgi:hypothetical protein